jgi:intracellular septation protein
MKWLQSLIEEVSPIIVLGLLNNFYGFEIAVFGMVATMVLIVVVISFTRRGLPWFAVLSTVGVFSFAALSYFLGDFSYFALSDTILDGGLGLLILWSLRWKETLLSKLFSRTFAITEKAWRILTVRWGVLFICLATLNELVRLNFPNETWVTFKVVATTFIFLFGCYQFTLSVKERIVEDSNWLGLRK